MTSSTGLLASVGDTSVPVVLPAVGGMRDQELLDVQREVAEVQRRVSAIAAAVAGEIAHRSRRELGHGGLAASRGQRSVEGLISHLTGGSAREARTLVQAGELMPTVAPRASAPPVAAWLAVIGEAVASAAISVEAAGVMRSRLASTRMAREVAAADLVDEYRIRVCPVLAGGGIPFFSRDERRVDLELVDTQTFANQVVYLRYRVAR